MKNLQIIDIIRVDLPRRLENLEHLIIVDDAVFFVERGKLFYYVRNGIIQLLCGDKDCITELTYLPAYEHVWFGTGTEFVFICVKTLAVKVVATPSAFSAASWAPNGEVIAMCEADRNVRCYRNAFYNPIVTLNIEDQKDIPIPEGATSVRIAWKNNSQEFCMWYKVGGNYNIQIHDILGEMRGNPIDVPGMCPYVTWKRSFLVCATRKENGRFFVSLYEKNGLCHLEFELDDDVINVGQIKWNETTDILAVNVLTKEGSFLNFYMQPLFKYQLKQQLVSTCENPLKTFDFLQCTEQVIGMFIATAQRVTFHKLIFKIQTGLLPNRLGFHAEIDDKKLIFQRIDGDFEAGLNEPIQVLETKRPINLVTFHHAYNRLSIVDSYSNIFIYAFLDEHMIKVGQFFTNINAPHHFLPVNLYNLCFISELRLLLVYISTINNYNLYEYNMETNHMIPVKLDEHINYMIYVKEYNEVLKLKSDKIVYLNDYQHLSPIDFELCQMNYVIVDGEFYIISLDIANQMRVNNNVVCKSVTSFTLSEGYLFIIAFGSRLYCIPLKEENMRNLCNEPLDKLNLFSRNCEEGSVLLGSVPNQKYVVLYHSRGNTEMILCRNVAVDQVKTYIEQEHWKDAFEYMRIEKLDLNLLADININHFLTNIESFVCELDSPSLLQAFVLALDDQNVLETTFKDVNYTDITVIPNKRKVVCEAVLNAVKNDVVNYANVCVLASEAIGGIEASVEMLYHLYINYGDAEDVLSQATKCLTTYFSVSDVQKGCVLKGDIEFAKCFFEKLNVDPKTYDPLLAEVAVHNADVFRQFFILHNYVENFKEALQYLVINCVKIKHAHEECDVTENIEEMIEYAENHKLIAELYKYCIKHSLFNKRIIMLYTEYLRNSERHNEAALIFKMNLMWNEALDVSVHSGLWRDAMLSMDNLDVDRREYTVLLAISLKSHGNYAQAAHVYDYYLEDAEQAVSCLVTEKLYKEAMACSFKFNREDLIEGIRRDYLQYYTSLIDRTESSFKLFIEYVRRLKAVRNATATFAATAATADGIQDLAESVAGSLRTASTSRSIHTLSSSRSRRTERKMQDLRQGGEYENIALMRTLHGIIREAYQFCSDIKRFCELLISFEYDGILKAKALQDAQVKFLGLISDNLQAIWPPELNLMNATVTPELTSLRRNLDLLEMKYRYPPEPVPFNWKVTILDELVDSAALPQTH